MRRYLILAFSLVICKCLQGQFAIGHLTYTFNDPTRTGGFGSGGGPGRQIQTEVYYPATAAGDNTPFVQDSFPIIVFGHGFVMTWDAYQNIWQELVPKGYIMLFPRTEGNITPNHQDFGLDLALIVNSVRTLSQNPSSVFYNRIASTAAIMGHSMGGGATFLAAQNNTNITCIATLAAANTNPSSIVAAKFVKVPTLIIAGGNDCVAPPGQHQIPMYDSTGSACKTYISITGGSHCQFAENNFNCNFGESTCSPAPTITRPVQHQRTFKYLVPWLNKYLKGSCHPQSNIDSLLSVSISSEITWNQSCVPQAGIDKTICEGQSTTIGSTHMYGYSFSWTSIPSGFSSNQPFPSVSPTSTTSYIVTYTNQYSQCLRKDTVTVYVNPAPVANAGNDIGTCLGSPVNIGSSPQTGHTYTWIPITQLSAANIANPQVNATQAGVFQYVLTVSNTSGCSSKDTVNVTITPNFSVQATGGTSVCANTSVQLNATITPFMPASITTTSTLPISIPDNSPSSGLQTGNNLPTLAQLSNPNLASAVVTLSNNNYILKGITFSVNHTFCADLDIYLVGPNNQIFVISTDNGGSNDNYTNVTFTDTAANFPPTSAPIIANGYYKPEVGTFSSYTGPMQGNWTLYVIDDASADVGQILDFKLNVLEVPSNLTYQWTPGLGLNNTTIINPISNTNTTTTYTIQVTHVGCTQTSSTTVNILPTPQANAGNDATICVGENITIGSNPTNNTTYAWSSYPTGFSSNISNPQVSPATTTTYYLTVTDNITSCTNHDTVTIHVVNVPTVTITSSGPTTFCQGNSVTLTANTGFLNYTWSNGVTGTNSITVNQSGSYYVIAGNSTTCIDTSSSIVITVNTPIVPNISIDDTSICSGQNTTIQVINGPFTTYNWQGVSSTNSSATVNQSGTYFVITTDNNGCTAISNVVSLTVNNPIVPTITQSGNNLVSSSASSYQWYLNGNPIPGANSQSYTVTQNGTYTVETTDINGCTAISNPYVINSLSIAEINPIIATIYPNPASTYLIVAPFDLNTFYSIVVYSLEGKVIYQSNNHLGVNTIDCSTWASGIYSVNIANTHHQTTYRIVKN